MNCLKCGRDVPEEQLFCESCLEVMAKYPVKPNTAIQLPHREEHAFIRKPQPERRQAPNFEEKYYTALRILRRILVLWLITIGLLTASLYPAVKYLLGDTFRLPGQNYSTFSTAPTEAPVSTEATTTPTAP